MYLFIVKALVPGTDLSFLMTGMGSIGKRPSFECYEHLLRSLTPRQDSARKLAWKILTSCWQYWMRPNPL